MVERGVVFAVAVFDKIFYKTRITYNDANGSGHKFALAALDHGKTAEEAVGYAATRCVYTGGAVQVINVESGE